MRGKAFHNMIAEKARAIFSDQCWQVYTEYSRRRNGITTYFDLYAIKNGYEIACEIETTVRHAIDNINKALMTDTCLWVIVPTRGIRRQIEQKPIFSTLSKTNPTLKILLPCQLETELHKFSHKYILKGTKS